MYRNLLAIHHDQFNKNLDELALHRLPRNMQENLFLCEYSILFIARTQIDEYLELNEQLSSFAWCHQSQTVLISKFHARTSYGVIRVLQLTSTLVLN